LGTRRSALHPRRAREGTWAPETRQAAAGWAGIALGGAGRRQHGFEGTRPRSAGVAAAVFEFKGPVGVRGARSAWLRRLYAQQPDQGGCPAQGPTRLVSRGDGAASWGDLPPPPLVQGTGEPSRPELGRLAPDPGRYGGFVVRRGGRLRRAREERSPAWTGPGWWPTAGSGLPAGGGCTTEPGLLRPGWPDWWPGLVGDGRTWLLTHGRVDVDDAGCRKVWSRPWTQGGVPGMTTGPPPGRRNRAAAETAAGAPPSAPHLPPPQARGREARTVPPRPRFALPFPPGDDFCPKPKPSYPTKPPRTHPRSRVRPQKTDKSGMGGPRAGGAGKSAEWGPGFPVDRNVLHSWIEAKNNVPFS